MGRHREGVTSFVARVNAVRAFKKFGVREPWVAVANLLGYPTYSQLANKQSKDDTRKLEMLAGPHGYTYYRVLKERGEKCIPEMNS